MDILSPTYRYYYKKLLLLSYPIMLGNAGYMITGIADAVMVGHLGSLQLAAVAFANTVFVIPFVFGIGFSVGLTPLTGQAYGSNNEAKCSGLLKHALIFNFITAIIITLLMVASSFYMDRMGQQPDVVKLAIPFFNILNLSLIPMMVYLTLGKFTDGLGMTKPAMVASLVMNLLNVLLNWLLIYGHWGFPELGMKGSAVATLIARIGMALWMLGYIYLTPLKRFLVGFGRFVFSGELLKEIFAMGLPIGLQFLLEVGAFTVGTIWVGSFSHQALAAHQVSLSMIAFTYLMASGISSGATIEISNLFGRKEYHQIRTAGRAAFIMVLAFMGFCAIGFMLGRHQLPLLFNTEPEVVAIAATLLTIAAFFQLSDGLQVTVIGALRGISDVNAPTWVALFSYWVVTLPLSYLLGMYLHLGPMGIWLGYLIGLTIASVLLLLRFRNRLALLDKKHNYA